MALYELLPSIYRFLDEQEGLPLKALLQVLESEYDNVKNDLDRLYDNLFIETCEPWVIPYIADLVGVDDLVDAERITPGQRRRVANTLATRRRKGTHAALEQIVEAVTGWGVRVLEFSDQIAVTQNLEAPKPNHGKLFQLTLTKDSDSAWVGTAFDSSSRTVDIRSGSIHNPLMEIESEGYRPMTVGIYLWRLRAYPLTRTTPARLPDGRYTFSPDGRQVQLYKEPVPWMDETRPNDIGAVPGPLFRIPMEQANEKYRETKAARIQLQRETLRRAEHFKIYLNQEPVKDENILICSLGDAKRVIPAQTKSYDRPDGTSEPFDIKVAIDPELGLLAFPGEAPDDILVDYAYGAVDDLGAGPYDRQDSLGPNEEIVFFVARRYAKSSKLPKNAYSDLADAIRQWRRAKHKGPIRIMDNATYELPEETIALEDSEHLIIEAANGCRPFITGDLKHDIKGAHVSLTLNGLFLSGALRLDSQADKTHLKTEIHHCTFVPGDQPSILQDGSLNHDCTIQNSIMGSITIQDGLATLYLTRVLIDGGVDENLSTFVAMSGSPAFVSASFDRCTILGAVVLRELKSAVNTIFLEPVTVKQCAKGILRYCYVPKHSQTPTKRQCVPHEGDDYEPIFVSTTFGDPAFGQLAHQSHQAIRTGAESGSELGVYHDLFPNRALAGLESALLSHLPFGFGLDIRFIS